MDYGSVDLLITTQFALMPYDNPVGAPFAIPDRLLSSAERPHLRLCSILAAYTISLEDSLKSFASLVSSNLDRCLFEYFDRLRVDIVASTV
jgi:hypothetical protein